MPRIEWSRRTSEETESMVSMFLCREFPSAYRVRPARGDGGIDVCIPSETDPNHYTVYQVKYFATNLTSTQWAQINKSHSRLRTYASERGWVIDQWYLTMPLDPTPGNLVKLTELQETGDFPCEWRGLSHADGWAAKYQDIVDYYLHDGRERLAEDLARFSAIAHLPMAAPTDDEYANLAPADVLDGLTQLRESLNIRDPHFEYDIAISGSVPPVPDNFAPSTVALNTRQIGDSWVTFTVHARCAESLNERPVESHMTLVVTPESDEHRELKEFIEYGRPFTLPIEARDLSITMPGGLGMTDGSGSVRLLPAPSPEDSDQGHQRRMRVITPDDQELASVIVNFTPLVTNQNRTGGSNRGRDESGVLEVEIMSTLTPPYMMRQRFTRGPINGRFPDEVEQAVAFVANCHPPNRISVEAVRGAHRAAVQECPTDADFGVQKTFLTYLRNLQVIQEHTSEEIRIPEELDDAHLADVHHVAQLLRREPARGTWSPFSITVHDGSNIVEDEERPYIIDARLEVSIGDVSVDLGLQRMLLESARIEDIVRDDSGEPVAVTLTPGESNTAQFVWHGPTSIGQRDG
ncbi:hypothetical protein L1080_037460 [Rhodococcus sp. MSC1_016]|uniref:hypothetical protein n=1 Tax=Rhodococcus sp. MSC1_016 TaxID=2909266 RepID=UPI00202DFC56|nr:hypothetical protein [Rhodococcus sp. MSC1_016]